MANMAAIFANRGYFYTPHMIRAIDKDSVIKYPKRYTYVNSEYFDPIVDAMEAVVKNGTAGQANLNHITICGKTGTAQNPHGEDHSIFIAFAPKENPKIAIACYIENAGFGGTWAAPISSLVIEKYLTDTISIKWREERILNKRFY
jgi:penicillin-binding protein 2